jgi:hypothetical protein
VIDVRDDGEIADVLLVHRAATNQKIVAPCPPLAGFGHAR